MGEYNSDSERIDALLNALREQIEENKTLKKGCIDLTNSFLDQSKIINEVVRVIQKKVSIEDFELLAKKFVEEFKYPHLFFTAKALGMDELIPGVFCEKDLLDGLG